jgi:hypothetical protein
MLDEVKSLIQKSLRRKEHSLIKKAAKELIGGQKDQLKWQNIVTFMFEDHCLNHVEAFEKMFDLYKQNKKYECIELISKCYTCRYSACLQVVAISEKHRNYKSFWEESKSEDPSLQGLVAKVNNGINCDALLANIVKKWRENDASSLVSLFGLVNMAAKVEGRQLTEKGMKCLLGKDVKKPTLYHLVLSILYHRTTDEYIRRMIRVCFRFITIPDTAKGLIMFNVLTQLIHKDLVLKKQVPDTAVGKWDWNDVGKLEAMPEWAVDKHTYRGKFGKASKHLFLKKFKSMNLTEKEIEEFHGERPKAGMQIFFDVGCICRNDILPENPIWEETKEMYLKQKPSLQKCAKMTKLFYSELLEGKSIVMMKHATSVTEIDVKGKPKQNRKRKSDEAKLQKDTKKSKLIDDYMVPKKHAEQQPSTSSVVEGSSRPKGPLLQLPTGSGKVYTILDEETQKVWKGPYKIKERQNLCVFLHRAMTEVFGDKHTLAHEIKGKYIIFPLLKSTDTEVAITHKAYYDCISKREISEEEGKFVERHSLGIVQVHKLRLEDIRRIPVTLWLHFVWRYCLNIGDSGLYNAIATKDLREIYGIDMEERRLNVKGNGIVNMMFTKLPRKEVVKEIEKCIVERVEEFHGEISKDIDFISLAKLYELYGLKNETNMCKERIEKLKNALDTMCMLECGI